VAAKLFAATIFIRGLSHNSWCDLLMTHHQQTMLNRYIDHTLLKPDASLQEIERLCAESIEHRFAAICINPCWVKQAHALLKGSEVLLCSVVGFPLGANTTDTKAAEARQLSAWDVQEIDMVMNIGALKSHDADAVIKDIRAVVQAAPSAIIKVILETCLLTDEEKVLAARLVKESGAHFVKTSTGFSKGGATLHDVALLRKTVGPDFGVKASGGIRDLAFALAMIEAGATRIGTSSGVALMDLIQRKHHE
jgi:deoxyribose-phosphate aldolase